ncbi:MAG: aspartate kinase [Candidatus Diapherotrites archaeon]|nr:aspartate kinase [Candidatus Diapherotrites archaeon]
MKNCVVLKIGGGILKDADCFYRVVDIIKKKRENKEECIVVISALYGVTDFLIESIQKAIISEEQMLDSIKKIKDMHKQYLSYIKNQRIRDKAEFALDDKIATLEKIFYGINYLKEVSPRSKDLIQSFGERISPIVLEAFLLDNNIDAEFIDAEKAGIYCKGNFENALVDMEKTADSLNKTVLPLLNKKVVLLPGYYGIDELGDVKTFGRGGTDYSAGFIAAIFNAKLEIWKDVSGFMSADPKVVKEAKQIDVLSYDEAEELGYLGAKILHPKTIEPLREKGLSAEIKNIFDPGKKGTIISSRELKTKQIVKSIATKKDIAIVNISSSAMANSPGFAAAVFAKLSENNISVDLISTSETAISFSISPKNLQKAIECLEQLKEPLQCKISFKDGLSLIGVVGEGMIETPGIAGRIFSALGKEKINVELISQGASEINISFVVKNKDLEKAVCIIHKEFIS